MKTIFNSLKKIPTLTIRYVLGFVFSLFSILFITFPLFFFFLTRKIFTGRNIFSIEAIYTKKLSIITVRYYNSNKYYLRILPLYFYTLMGRLHLVGPSIKTTKLWKSNQEPSELFAMKPGIFCLWFIRESSRIPNQGQIATDMEYLSKKNLIYDCLLILRTVPAFFFYYDGQNFKNSINLLGVSFLNITMTEAMDIIEGTISRGEKKSFFFVNPNCLNQTFKDPDYLKVLKEADYVFPDGIGLTIACNMLKTPLKENINGTDMFPFLCELMNRKYYSVYLLGAEPGIAEKVAENIKKKYPGIDIAGFRDGYFDKGVESLNVIRTINSLQPDVLLVAMGTPEQEKWLSHHFEDLQPSALFGVGGLFDFYSGKNIRAPRWLRELGFEWLFRIFQEPGRMWKRYILGNPLFLYRVWRWKKNQ